MKSLLLMIIFGASFAVNAQGQSPTVPENSGSSKTSMAKVIQAELMIDICRMAPQDPKCLASNPVQDMTDAYLAIIKEKTHSNKLIARAAEKGLTNLLLVIAAQNQRIIELLEEKK